MYLRINMCRDFIYTQHLIEKLGKKKNSSNAVVFSMTATNNALKNKQNEYMLRFLLWPQQLTHLKTHLLTSIVINPTVS